MADDDKYKIFISWSGDLAKQVANQIHGLLPKLIDGVNPWMSANDIQPGDRSMSEIAEQLDTTSFGIILVTRANQWAPWLNFEAGALSKRFGTGNDSRVIPLLVDMDSPAEIDGPLTQFQVEVLNRDGMAKVVTLIATECGASVENVKERLDWQWEGFEGAVRAAIDKQKDPGHQPTHRDQNEMVEETLELVRGLSRSMRRLTNSSVSSLDDPDLSRLELRRGLREGTRRARVEHATRLARLPDDLELVEWLTKAGEGNPTLRSEVLDLLVADAEAAVRARGETESPGEAQQRTRLNDWELDR